MPKWKKDFAKYMRRNPTEGEKAAWKLLRPLRYSHAFRFRRQAPCLGYILDFYCPSAKLVIEIDGPGHNPIDDPQRDHNLAVAGFLTVRFSTELVLQNPYGFIEAVVIAAAKRTNVS